MDTPSRDFFLPVGLADLCTEVTRRQCKRQQQSACSSRHLQLKMRYFEKRAALGSSTASLTGRCPNRKDRSNSDMCKLAEKG